MSENRTWEDINGDVLPTRRRARESHASKESEKVLETKLRTMVEDLLNGKALKLSSQLHRGLPDRMVLMPGGKTYFAEMKSTGKKPTKLQLHAHQQLRDLGFEVWVIDSTESLNNFLGHISIPKPSDNCQHDL